MADLYWRNSIFSFGPREIAGNNPLMVEQAHAIVPLVWVVVQVGVQVAVRYAVKEAIRATIRGAAKNLIGFMMGRSNSRIPPVLLLGAIGYLQTRTSEELCTGDCLRLGAHLTDKVEKDRLTTRVDSLVKKLLTNVTAFGELKDGKSNDGEISCGFTYDTHGAAFELYTIALFHMLHEFAKLDYFRIEDIQRYNKVWFHQPNSMAKSDKNADRLFWFARNTDIVLKGKGELPLYVELKSYPAHDKEGADQDSATAGQLNRKFRLWSFKDDYTSVHRQLLTDALLSSPSNVNEDKEQGKVAEDFIWYFQDWPLPKDRTKGKAKFRHAGNSVTRVKIQGKEQTGLEYLREERLAELGSDDRAQKGVAWNLGRAQLPNLAKQIFAPADLGLKKRVKPLSLWRLLAVGAAAEAGEELEGMPSKDQMRAMMKSALGIDDQTLDTLLDVEKFEENILQHIEKYKEQFVGAVQAATGRDVSEVTDELAALLEELQEGSDMAEELAQDVVNALTEALPTIDDGTCH